MTDADTPPAASRDVLYVVFTADGVPGWIGLTPAEGAERVEGLTLDFLVANRRAPDGSWLPRPPPPPPTAEELAALEDARRQAEAEAEAYAARAIEEEIARRAQPDVLLRAMGKITIAELTARVAAIRTEVEAGR